MPPSDYNGSFWQRTETEYFLDYERRALNTSLDTDHVDVDVNSEQEEHEDLDSEDLLLPWSCCVSHFLAQQEEKERQLNEPEALANTIRGRLLAKSKVSYRFISKIPFLSKNVHFSVD